MLKKFYLLMNQDDGSSGGGSGADDQGTGDQGQKNNQGQGDSTGGNQSMTLEDAQKVIKDLRAEAAKYRTEKNNLSTRLEKLEKGLKGFVGGDDEDKTDPLEKLKMKESEVEQLSVKTAMYELAIDHSIPKDQFEYFEFLMSKKLNTLEEGEEMTEEDLGSILSQLKVSGAKGPANTSTGTGNKPNGNQGNKDDVTLEQFVKMTVLEKSKLYQTKPDTYNSLVSQAKEKNLLK